MTDELPPEHVVRVYPPWRHEPPKTECGLAVLDDNALTNEEFHRKIREYGQTRARHLFCRSCWQRAAGYGDVDQGPRSWEADPVGVVRTDLGHGRPADYPEPTVQARELRVLALLAEAHREEYDDAMASLAEMPDVAVLSRDRRAAAAYRKNTRRSTPPHPDGI